MSELDFDRSVPPIIPRHGDEFNALVAKLVEQANGDEAALSEVVIDMPRQRELEDIPQVEYSVPDHVPFYGSQLRTS